MNKMFTGIICQTIEREVGYSTAKKNVILASIFNSQSIFYGQNYVHPLVRPVQP